MNLQLTAEFLQIQLSPAERFWSFHFAETIAVPRAHIVQASHQWPESTWRELRAPGTFLPGVIKAGTYYTERGREFWYTLASNPAVLTLDLDASEYYKRIVVGVPEQCEIRAEQLVR